MEVPGKTLILKMLAKRSLSLLINQWDRDLSHVQVAQRIVFLDRAAATVNPQVACMTCLIFFFKHGKPRSMAVDRDNWLRLHVRLGMHWSITQKNVGAFV